MPDRNSLPLPPTPARTRCWTLAAVCAAAAAMAVTLGRPVIGRVTVSYLETPSLMPRPIELPFSDTAAKASTVFVVDATVTLSPISSARLRVAADECIESVAVNGGSLRNLRERDDKNRCWPQSYTLGADTGLHAGVNHLRLVLTNEKGPHGVHISPLLDPAGVLAAAGLMWAAVYLWLRGTLVTAVGVAGRPGGSRHLIRLVLPSLGLLFIGGQLVNARGWPALSALPVVFLATSAVAAALLFHALDLQRPRPLPVRVAPGWAAVSVLAFAVVSAKSLSDYEPIPRFLFTLLGAVAGCLAVTPTVAAVHRARQVPGAVALAAVMAAAPRSSPRPARPPRARSGRKSGRTATSRTITAT